MSYAVQLFYTNAAKTAVVRCAWEFDEAEATAITSRDNNEALQGAMAHGLASGLYIGDNTAAALASAKYCAAASLSKAWNMT